MIKVKITGMAGLKAAFTAAPERLSNILSGELEVMMTDWVRMSKQMAPADQAALRQAISFYKKGVFRYEMVAQRFYAAFMEFGTKGKYKPQPGTETIAAQFKGYKGGDFMELLRNIVRWVKRKGIAGTYSVKTQRRTGSRVNQLAEDYSVAWPIAMSILRNGIKPHPYFFPPMQVVWAQMIQQVEQRLKGELQAPVFRTGSGGAQIQTI